jgi:hypothetical protein
MGMFPRDEIRDAPLSGTGFRLGQEFLSVGRMLWQLVGRKKQSAKTTRGQQKYSTHTDRALGKFTPRPAPPNMLLQTKGGHLLIHTSE